MTQSIITQPQSDIIEQVIIKGDLSQLSPAERVNYYRAVCESIGLNPLTKPFEYIDLDGKLTLYARRDATDQLRKIHNISIAITGREKIEDVYIVTAKASTQDGRSDESTGVVSITKEDGEWKTAQSGKRYFVGNGTFKPLRSDALANALMKAETKSKRRVTLSLCGLGWLDETEIETIPNAKKVDVKENGDLGPTWTEQTATQPVIEHAQPTTQPPAENGKPASLKFQAFVTWANEWVKGNGKDYANADGRVDMRHLLGRIGKLGFASVTEQNADDIKAALESYVKGKVDTQ